MSNLCVLLSEQVLLEKVYFLNTSNISSCLIKKKKEMEGKTKKKSSTCFVLRESVTKLR